MSANVDVTVLQGMVPATWLIRNFKGKNDEKKF